jgi:hydrogenase maturation protease
MLSTHRLAVIGCGNLNRSDDGVGVVVAHRLKQWLKGAPCNGVAVFDAGTGGMDVMFQARGAASLIIVDACVSGSQPGSIFKLPGHDLTNRPEPSYSLHDFRWDHALYAGQKIFRDEFPADVTVYLVEAATVSLGVDLRPAVSAAADQVVTFIKDQIGQIMGAPRPGPFASHAESGSSPEVPRIRIRGGNLYLEASVYKKYFAGLESVILLRQQDKMLILPVRHAAAGGLFLKVRNPQGDRVVHAQEFLRDQGLDEQQEWTLPVQWNSQSAALVAEWPSSR